MDVSLWMSRELLTVLPSTTVAAAARMMAQHRVRHLIVVEPNETSAPASLAGVLTSHDLFLASDPGTHPMSPVGLDADAKIPVRDIMTAKPMTVTPTTSIEDAARLLRQHKFSCLPVVDRGRPVGILTEHDVLRAFLELTGADDTGYEVTFVVADSHDAVVEMADLGKRYGMRLTSVITFVHDGKRLGLVRFAGGSNDTFLSDVWKCGHTVLRVRANR